MRLLESPPAEVTSGEILFQGQDLLELSNDETEEYLADFGLLDDGSDDDDELEEE